MRINCRLGEREVTQHPVLQSPSPPQSHIRFYNYRMGSITTTPKLFEPIRVGTTLLKHRVAFAPCTRFRADPITSIPNVPLMKTYYEQRASVPGTLLITEGVFIAQRAGGMAGVPGIWSDEQVTAWKEVHYFKPLPLPLCLPRNGT
jgi:NADH:flavin oxidoreductase / NADH oxidase family